jgi:UDP-glucuronate decarboxylase
VSLEEGLEATIAWFSREIAPRRPLPSIEERAFVAG